VCLCVRCVYVFCVCVWWVVGEVFVGVWVFYFGFSFVSLG